MLYNQVPELDYLLLIQFDSKRGQRFRFNHYDITEPVRKVGARHQHYRHARAQFARPSVAVVEPHYPVG
jgi:hypothetical protein